MNPTSKTPQPARRVLVIGWDAADWRVVNPLLDAGQLPHLERMIAHGVMGNIATLHPILSPMLWTSIATGKRAFKHGICGFSEPDPHSGGVRPISSLSRKTKAVWNILSQSGLKSNVVGWWPSHPAEPIRGVMVSNHFQRAQRPYGEPWPMPPGTVHPERLSERLADLRLHPQELTFEHASAFIPRLDEIDQEKDKRVEDFARTLADCITIHAAATEVMQSEPWDFMGVYYDAIDHFSHGFMRFHPPRLPWVAEQDFELYQGVLEGAYRFHDMMLGSLLRQAGQDTNVILLSDHGFHPDHLRPRSVPAEPAGPAAEHRHFGILVMAGPGIKKDERIHGASLLDICPTVLTLFGLPVGEDMDGQPLLTAFETPPEIRRIPSWDLVPGEAGLHPSDLRLDPLENQASLDQLIALGYLESPHPDRTKAIEQTVAELHFNRARSFMDANQHLDAIPLLADLYAKNPGEHRFGWQLALCYRALAQHGPFRSLARTLLERRQQEALEGQQALRQWLQIHGSDVIPTGLPEAEQEVLQRLHRAAHPNLATLEYLQACVEANDGHPTAAVAHLETSERLDPGNLGLQLRLGDLYLELGERKQAMAAFERALAIDPENAGAQMGLGRCHLAQRNFFKAAEAALAAVGLVHFNPPGHYLLGNALQQLGAWTEARNAFLVAIAQSPSFVEAHRRLAALYARHLAQPDLAADHRRLAREARERIRTRAKHVPPVLGQSPSGRILEELPVPAHPSASAVVPDPPTLTSHSEASDGVITIVTGLPRSGTSMMMQMLRAGGLTPFTDGLRVADEDNPRGYFEHAAATRLATDQSWLPEAKGKAVKIVAQLMRHLPAVHSYQVVFMERDFKELLASQTQMLERQGKQSAGIPEDRLGRTYQYHLDQIKQILALRQIPVLYVSHRECVQQPATVAVRVNDFLGGALDSTAMAQVVDPALHRHKGFPHLARGTP